MKTPRIFRVLIEPHCPECGSSDLYLRRASYEGSEWSCNECHKVFAGDQAAGNEKINSKLLRIADLIKEIESSTT